MVLVAGDIDNGRPLVGEFLGGDCTPDKLAAAMAELIGDEAVRARHRAGYDQALRQLGVGGPSPSLRAADRILAVIAASRADGEPCGPANGERKR